MGHAISKVVHDVGHAFKSAVHTVGHVASEVGHGVEHAVHGVEHYADAAENAVTHAVVDVGHVASHLLSHVPVVGGALASGVAGVTDLAKLSNEARREVGHALLHPEDTVKRAIRIVKDPEQMRKLAEHAAGMASRVAHDASKALNAASIVAPELKPLAAGADAALATADDIEHGRYKHLLRDVGSRALSAYQPGSKLGKVGKESAGLLLKHATAAGFDGGEMELIPFGNYAEIVDVFRRWYPDEDITFHMFDRMGPNARWIDSITIPAERGGSRRRLRY